MTSPMTLPHSSTNPDYELEEVDFGPPDQLPVMSAGALAPLLDPHARITAAMATALMHAGAPLEMYLAAEATIDYLRRVQDALRGDAQVEADRTKPPFARTRATSFPVYDDATAASIKDINDRIRKLKLEIKELEKEAAKAGTVQKLPGKRGLYVDIGPTID